MRNKGTVTRYAGIYRVDEMTYWIRAKATDPRTGKKKEVAKLLEGVTIQQAAQHRADLVEATTKPITQAKKMRVGTTRDRGSSPKC